MLLAVVAGLVGLFAGSAPTFAGPAPNIVVDTNFPACIQNVPKTYSYIQQGIDNASPGDTIYVCPAFYYEATITVDVSNIKILGPGTTPANDGSAVIQVSTLTTNAQMDVTADSVTIRGLDFEGTRPPSPYNMIPYGIRMSGSYGEISDNTFVHMSAYAIQAYKYPSPIDVTIQRNQVTLSQLGIICICDYSYVQNNTVGEVAGSDGIRVTGQYNTVDHNGTTGDNFSVFGDNSVVDSNTLYGNDKVVTLLSVGGNPITVSNNTFSGTQDLALSITENPFGPAGNTATNATVSHNTFQYVTTGIQIYDSLGGPTVNAKIGGSPADTNTFAFSGPGPLLRLKQMPADVNAKYNDWSLCSLPEIENVITHHPDDATLGTADYDPFVAPASCATPTPTPSPTHSATPTHSSSPTPSPTSNASLTPTPTPSATSSAHLQGDLNCDGGIDGTDALPPLLKQAGLTPTHRPNCPALGAGSPEFGDVNCDGEEEAADTIAILQYAADLEVNPPQPDGCTPLGEALPA